VTTSSLPLISALSLVVGAAIPAAQAPHAENVVSTRHQAVVGGKTIGFTADRGLLPIYVNDTGEQMAMFFIATPPIVRQDSRCARSRSCGNGGPGPTRRRCTS
jgi:hypothetical protein